MDNAGELIVVKQCLNTVESPAAAEEPAIARLPAKKTVRSRCRLQALGNLSAKFFPTSMKNRLSLSALLYLSPPYSNIKVLLAYYAFS